MTNEEKIQEYIGLVPFLSEVLGKGCEVVVHDLRDPEHSITAIANPISGRKIGDPMTDFDHDDMEGKDYIANYHGKSDGISFKSSTYLIRNKNKVIGLLCINKEVDCVVSAQKLLNDLFDYYNISSPEESEFSENLGNSIDDLMRSKIDKVIRESMVPVARMTNEEKRKIVNSLKQEGVLSMKGAIAELSRQLEVSIPSIYRYLKKTE